EQIGFKPAPPYGFIVPVRGDWYQPEYTREIFKIQNHSNLIRMKQESGRIELRGCYCSIYEQCYIFSRSQLEAGEVDSCEPIPEITLKAPLPRH
ncbi:MAG: hypothetical protein JSW26_01785, partial [Desulfobacterales bacterium]